MATTPRLPAAALFIALALGAASGGHANAATLDAGISHNLAVTSAGHVVAWGGNSLGALGNGTRVHSSIPVRSGTLTRAMAVAAGSDVSVALLTDGTVWAWGNAQLTPVQVPGLTDARAVAVNSDGAHTFMVALLANGTVRAWGDNRFGTLGNGTTVNQAAPVAVSALSGIVAIAAGRNHAVALRSDGTVWAWGVNERGELGASLAATPANSCGGVPCAKTPVQVFRSPGVALTAVSAIAAKGRHTLALLADGAVWAWGSNYYGQLGDGTAIDRPAPIQVLTNVASIAAGASHSIALRRDGSYWAWGLDMSGQLGLTGALVTETCQERNNGTTPLRLWACRKSPTNTGRSGVGSVSAGGAHTLSVRADGSIAAFGLNSHGQLGTGTPRVSDLFVDECDSDPSSCPNRVGVGSTASGVSVGRASTPGGLNLTTLDAGLEFAAQPVGTTSAGQEVVVLNASGDLTDPIRIVAVSATGDFSQQSNCVGAILPYSASCSVLVTFSPGTPGSRAGVLTLATDVAAVTALATAQLELLGTGTGSALTLTKQGSGSGTVTSSPSGINCGSTCTAYFAPNTTVTLTQSAAAGSTFGGWGGACAGTGSCVVTMNATKDVSATFGTATAITSSVTAKTLGSRATVSPGATLYGGFEIGSGGQVYILVRGNSLGTLGVTQAFLDAPRVQVFNAQGQNIAFDSGGRPGFNGCDAGNAAAAPVVNFYQNVRRVPVHIRDGCIAQSLAAGAYTFTVTPSVAANTGGVASAPAAGEVLFEVSLGGGNGSITTTLGSRATVTPTATHYGGFELASAATVYILVRGNSLGTLGVTQGYLDAPRVRVYDAVNRDLVTDSSGRAGFNNCAAGSTVADYYQNVRRQPAHARDACVAQTLQPGSYTFTVTPSIAGQTTSTMQSAPPSGEALFEVTLR